MPERATRSSRSTHCGSGTSSARPPHLYKAEEVAQADDYIRKFVALVHGAGAKAVLYIGPGPGALFSPEFVQAHPDWLRVKPDGKPDAKPNFANIRSGYADWLLRQLAHVVRTYKVDGFWLDGYAPAHLHTYDRPNAGRLPSFSGGQEIPHALAARRGARPARPTVPCLARGSTSSTLADRMRTAIRAENPEAVLFVNHSGNRTWYAPEAYMGEYPLRYSRAVDVSSVELYWDVPGDALYQPFVYAFMQADHAGTAPPRSGSSPRSMASPASRRRWRSSFGDSRGRLGA